MRPGLGVRHPRAGVVLALATVLAAGAGMAAPLAAQVVGSNPAEAPAWLEGWRREARRRFQAAYFARLGDARRGDLRLAPASEEARLAALNFFELEKAVYEAGYELRNRPDWLALPLAGLERLLR